MKSAGMTPYPDLILYNGIINGLPKQGLAIAGGFIVAVGSGNELKKLAGTRTETLNLDGRLVLPGFIDTHIHFHEWALRRKDLQLDGVSSLQELLDSVFRQAARLPPSGWIIGQGFNETSWPEKRLPTRDDLDRVAPDHPVLLWRCDLHLAVANSVALAKAKIDKTPPDHLQSEIERDGNGTPTGIVRELAINLVRDVIDPPDMGGLLSAYEEATKALYRLGITGIHDIRLMDDKDGGQALQTFFELDRTGNLGLRSWVTLPGQRLDELIELGIRSGFGSDRLRFGHVKYFADGGVGARTAWMSEPYLDAGCGMALIDMDALADAIARADRAGLSVMVHAIGDRANKELIGLFEHLSATPPPQGAITPLYPHRIEHLQTIQPGDVERLGRLPLALGVTPANMLLDIDLIDAVLGARGGWAYSFRALQDTGLPLMFSSDCPVCNPDPLLGIHAAVTRRRPDGTPPGGWYPESCLETKEVVDGYTSVPARVHGAGELGSVDLQKRADLAIFSHDFISGPVDELVHARVEMTLFDGTIVFRDF